jgi:hypothetical protein
MTNIERLDLYASVLFAEIALKQTIKHINSAYLHLNIQTPRLRNYQLEQQRFINISWLYRSQIKNIFKRQHHQNRSFFIAS